jgi:hypothetical protein
MRSRVNRLTAMAIAAAWLCLVPAAIAQDQSPASGSESPQNTSPAASITEQKLDAVATAAKTVVSVKSQYRQKLENAAPADQANIANEAQAALEKAVTDQGISVADYQAILEVAQTDPELRAKILQRIDASGSSEENGTGSESED